LLQFSFLFSANLPFIENVIYIARLLHVVSHLVCSLSYVSLKLEILICSPAGLFSILARDNQNILLIINACLLRNKIIYKDNMHACKDNCIDNMKLINSTRKKSNIFDCRKQREEENRNMKGKHKTNCIFNEKRNS